MKRWIIFVVTIFLAIIGRAAVAGTIEYSWTGTMEPRIAGVDPWEIGPAGRAFTILAVVEEDAVDLGGPAFVLSDARLVIEGLPEPSFVFGRIDFDDGPTRDSVSIALEDVRINGVAEAFYTSVRLPASTFAFSGPVEPPPLFPPTDTSSQSGALSDLSSYFTIVPTGVTVTSMPIPEPSTLLLAVLAIIGLILHRAANVGRTRKTSARRVVD
jgi:hypothetical protein